MTRAGSYRTGFAAARRRLRPASIGRGRAWTGHWRRHL